MTLGLNCAKPVWAYVLSVRREYDLVALKCVNVKLMSADTTPDAHVFIVHTSDKMTLTYSQAVQMIGRSARRLGQHMGSIFVYDPNNVISDLDKVLKSKEETIGPDAVRFIAAIFRYWTLLSTKLQKEFISKFSGSENWICIDELNL